MFIKKITIHGFKSYKEQVFEDDLSPKHNVVVGQNGSGKSNFFGAVQFVLSEKFSNLSQNERKALFHAGSGPHRLSAYVEIVFDNSNHQMVIPGVASAETVTIRRTIGIKQDEYRVNDRRFTAQEIRHLLESAGFSSSNPYYIVEQGKIVQLAQMREEERYNLLKDVAGTRVYEERRARSEELLADTSSRFKKIDDQIGQLDARLKQLEGEQGELKAYREAETKRRELEYAIYSLERSKAVEELNALNDKFKSSSATAASVAEREAQWQQKADDFQLRADRAAARITKLESQRAEIENERAKLVARRQKLELQEKDAKSAAAADDRKRSSLEKEEKELKAQRDKYDAEHKEKAKRLDHGRAEAQAATRSAREKGARLDFLQAKRGRQAQFSTKDDRNKWLQAEMKRNEDTLHSNEADIGRMREEIKQTRQKCDQAKKASENQSTRMKEREAETSDLQAAVKRALKERDDKGSKRRELWKEMHSVEDRLGQERRDLRALQGKYDKAVRYDIRQGLVSLDECLEEMNDDGIRKAVHGTIIDLIGDESDEYAKAIEATAGNALFNVVVDSFDVSRKILSHFNKRDKKGRVTFFPLDTCKGDKRDLPETDRYSPLLSHVKYDKAYKRVFAELFGRTLVTASIEACAQACKEHDCDVVTKDGDQVGRKGGITGGYTESSSSRLRLAWTLRKLQRRVDETDAKYKKHCQSVTAVEEDLTKIHQRIEEATAKLNASATDPADEQRAAEERHHRLTQEIAAKEAIVKNLEQANEDIKTATKNLRAELGSDFKSTLSADETAELEKLSATLGGERTQADKLQAESVSLETEVNVLASRIRSIDQRLVDVSVRRAALGSSVTADTVLKSEHQGLDAEIEDLKKQGAALEAEMEKLHKERRECDEQGADLRRKIIESQSANDKDKDSFEKDQAQRQLLKAQKDEADAKIRRIHPLPQLSAAVQAMPMSKLLQALRGANDALKKYAHVNKKAMEQFNDFSNSRTILGDKRDALRKEQEDIEQLMRKLDAQKGEAIERTFKQVDLEFRQVFQDLVNADGASADLFLVPNPDKKAADKYVAVRTTVCFGIGEPTAELGQLSGGQKSLVALSLIFAIQRCDPAPFYLFDEIDAALDAGYRSSVARMLQKQSEKCQFITATFKTEMLDVADDIYGIFFKNKVSQIIPITKDQATGILRKAENEAAESRSARKRLRSVNPDDNNDDEDENEDDDVADGDE